MQQNTYNTPPQPAAMFSAKQMRQMAKLKLKGKWSKAAPVFALWIVLTRMPAIILAIMGYSTAIQITPEMLTGEALPALPSLSWIGTVYAILMTGALSVSMSTVALNIIRDEDFGINTLGRGFGMFKQSTFTHILVAIYSFLWTLIFMIAPMIVMMLGAIMGSTFITLIGGFLMMICAFAAIFYVMRYELSFFVAADNPGMKASFALANSSRLMGGKIFSFVWLHITFFGWAILASVPEALCSYCFGRYFTEGAIVWLVLSIVTMLISAMAYGYFMAYLKSTCAVFYSAASGFFRTKDAHAPDPQPYTTLTPENIYQEFGNAAGFGGYRMSNQYQEQPPQSSDTAASLNTDNIPERIEEKLTNIEDPSVVQKEDPSERD